MKRRYLLLTISALSLFGCRKTPDTSQLSVDFVVQTAREPEANFATYKTYFISDTIALKTTNPNDSLWTDADAKQLVDAVRENMDKHGYTFVGHGSSPD